MTSVIPSSYDPHHMSKVPIEELWRIVLRRKPPLYTRELLAQSVGNKRHDVTHILSQMFLALDVGSSTFLASCQAPSKDSTSGSQSSLLPNRGLRNNNFEYRKVNELQQEADELRRKLRQQSSSNTEQQSPMAILTAAAMSDGSLSVSRPSNVPSDDLRQQWPISPPLQMVATQDLSTNIGIAPFGEFPIARTIDGYRVEGSAIQDIFRSFFSDYWIFLPILDPAETPNALYARSAMLFWAVLGVACRTYSSNPTMFNALSEKVLDLALKSLSQKQSSIPVVQGLLLILTWPLTERCTSHETTFPLAGALVHMAMGIGLHIPTASQDFTQAEKLRLTGDEVHKRRHLWAHCIVVYQRLCMTRGYYGLTIPDVTSVAAQFPGNAPAQKMNLGFQLKANNLITRLHSAVVTTGINVTQGVEQQRVLDNLIDIFDAQLSEIEQEATMYIDLITLKACRLHISALHFFKQFTTAHLFEINQLSTRACALLQSIHDANERTNFLSFAPKHFAYHALLAACALLRLLKSPVARFLDKTAEASFFQAINFEQRLSRHPNDVGAKAVTLLSQLFNSKTALNVADGSDLRPMRIRSRMSTSVVYDCIMRWREHCRGQSNTNGGVLESSAQPGDTMSDHNPGDVQSQRQEDVFQFSNDPFLSEFGWAVDQDLLNMGFTGW